MYYERTEMEERFQLDDVASNDGNDTFSANSDEDEFSDHESVVGDTITNNATVT